MGKNFFRAWLYFEKQTLNRVWPEGSLASIATKVEAG